MVKNVMIQFVLHRRFYVVMFVVILLVDVFTETAIESVIGESLYFGDLTLML